MKPSFNSRSEKNREDPVSSKDDHYRSLKTASHPHILKKIQSSFRSSSFDEHSFNKFVVPKAILDHEFDIVLVNEKFSKIDGRPRGFYKGKNFFTLFPDQQAQEVFTEVLTHKLPIVIHENCLHQEWTDVHRRLFWDWVVQPYDFDGKEDDYILLSLLKASNQKNTKRVMDNLVSRMKTILNSVHDGVYIVNSNYEIEYANNVILNDFGEYGDQPCYQYLHQLNHVCPNCDMPKVLSGETVSYEQVYPKIGKIFDVMDIPLKNLDGSTSKFRVMHDITRIKTAENELFQSNIALREKTNEERRHRNFAEALVRASNELNESINISVVLSRMMDHIKDGIRFTYGSIRLLDQNVINDRHNQFIILNNEQQLDNQKPFPVEEIFKPQELFSSKEPVLIDDTRNISSWNIKQDWDWVRSFLSVPIMINSKIIGLIILLDDIPGSFTSDVVRRTSAFASQASIAIRNAELFEKIRERNEQLKLLSQHQTKILEDERQYIARELHDEAGQSLTKLILDVHLLENQIDNPAELRENVHEIEESLVEISKKLHHIAMSLRPASLDHLGLIAAINQFVQALNQSNRIKIRVEDSGLKERLPKDMETIVYRIVQESLTNVIRHSQASQAVVKISAENHTLRVEISDNGVGFDPFSTKEPSHLGLLGMRERVQMVNGHISIDSAPNQGTRIIVEVDYGD